MGFPGSAGSDGPGWEPAAVPDAPAVPVWLSDGAPSMSAAARACGQSGVELEAVGRTLAALMTDTAVTLSWQADAAQVASARAGRAGGFIDRTGTALANAASALSIFGSRVAETATEVRDALNLRAALVADGQTNVARAGRRPLTYSTTMVDPATAEQLRALDARIRDAVTRLEDLDRTCRHVLGQAVDDLRALTQQAARDGWVGDVTVPAVTAVLTAHGALPNWQQQSALARAQALPNTVPPTHRTSP